MNHAVLDKPLHPLMYQRGAFLQMRGTAHTDHGQPDPKVMPEERFGSLAVRSSVANVRRCWRPHRRFGYFIARKSQPAASCHQLPFNG